MDSFTISDQLIKQSLTSAKIVAMVGVSSIKKEKSSRGWSKSVESSDFILKFRKTRSKNFDDMNCIEWLVFGLELAGYKISENVLTATTLSKWAEDKLSKIQKKNNLATFNKNY